MRLEEQLLQICESQNLNFGAAESCTGGAFASRITHIAGASRSFVGSIVSYTNPVKTRVLGVSEKILGEFGAVSIPVTLAMLEGALVLLESDLAVAITGIAGPTGGTLKIPIGTVFIAVGGKNRTQKTIQLNLTGNRQTIIEGAVDSAIQALIDIINI